MRLAYLHGENLRFTRTKPQGPTDAEILSAWRAGNDTLDIANKFFVPESEIANRLTRIRMQGEMQ